MLPKANFTSKTKCLAVFLMGNQWPLKQRVQILGLLWILLGNADCVFLMKAQITRKKINLPELFFVNQVQGEYQQLIAIFNLVKSKTVKIYSVVQSVKLLLALSILIYLSMSVSVFLEITKLYSITVCERSVFYWRSLI